MANRTAFGRVAHMANTGLAALGLTLSKIPERNSIERLVKTLLSDHQIDCVVDIGAHHGQFRAILKDVGYTGRIVSFEPSSEAFAFLTQASASDKTWEVHRLCLGEYDGSAEMQKFGSTDFNSLHAPTDFATGNWFKESLQPTGVETVPMRRLDTLLPELGLDPTRLNLYLKVDTQGHDFQVLQGAAATLPHLKVIQTELSALRLYQQIPTMAEVLGWLREQGFLPAGFFPVPCDPNPVIEWDCFFTRTDPRYLAQEVAAPH